MTIKPMARQLQAQILLDYIPSIPLRIDMFLPEYMKNLTYLFFSAHKVCALCTVLHT